MSRLIPHRTSDPSLKIYFMGLPGPDRDGTAEKPLHTLPNEVLNIIVGHCTRLDLFACCLVSMGMYEISIAYIYNDPFVEWPVYYGPDSDGRLQEALRSGFAEGRRKSSKLCRTLLENPEISRLVRKYHTQIWNNHVLKKEVARKIIPCLINLTEASPSFPKDAPFISTCPLQLQAVNFRSCWHNSSSPAAFWRWLEGQITLRRLHLDPSILPDLSPSALPRLDYLGASLTAARVILPNTTIRKFVGQEFVPYCWSREDVVGAIPLMGQSLCHIEGICVSALDVNTLFKTFAQHCPHLHTIKLGIRPAVGKQPLPYSAILSAEHGVPVLEILHIAMYGKVATAVPRRFAGLVTKDCPMLCRIN
ncbi:hypothetical protein FRB93_008815 [Tulasnella sp. JGI-2019a]|nr:hypothetical protein FRB93_008815 [Tulasnella sp. JGI-2019a]